MRNSLSVFEKYIRTDATRKMYLYYFKRFLLWAKIANPDDLLERTGNDLQNLVEEYFLYLRNRLSPNSLPPIVAALELFFSMNDKDLQFKKIRKMIPQLLKKTGNSPWQNADIKTMLENTTSRRNKALVHLLASSGCRVGAIPSLRLKHMSEMTEGCKCILFYEKSNEEYCGFLTPEASGALDDYLQERINDGERLGQETPLFRSNYQVGVQKVKSLSLGSVQLILFRLISKIGKRRREGTRYNIQIAHGFRKRFNTVLKSNDNANISLVEKLMGHSGVFALDGSYLKPSLETLFNEFRKHIPNLTIDDSERNRIKLEQKESRIKELEEKSGIEIKEIKHKLELHDALMKSISELVESMRSFTGNPNLLKSLEVGYVPDPSKKPTEISNLGRLDDDRPFSTQERSVS